MHILTKNCGFAGLRVCGFAGLRVCGFTGLRVCGFAGLRVCGFAGLRVCGFAGLRVCGFAGLRVCGFAGMRECGTAERARSARDASWAAKWHAGPRSGREAPATHPGLLNGLCCASLPHQLKFHFCKICKKKILQNYAKKNPAL